MRRTSEASVRGYLVERGDAAGRVLRIKGNLVEIDLTDREGDYVLLTMREPTDRINEFVN